MYKKTMSAKMKKTIYLHICTHKNISKERMINILWLSIDVIYAPYTDNRKKKRCRKMHIIYLQISKFNMTFPWKGKEIPWPCPHSPPTTHTHTHTHTHTQEGTSFEFKALREILEQLAWNSEELGFYTGRLRSKLCCTGAGNLRSH